MTAWTGIGRTDIGLVRAMNQDCFLALDQLGFWAVADGMGGHAGGDVAAHTAMAVASAHIEQTVGHGLDSPHDILQTLMTAAHQTVRDRAKRDPALSHMGTTLVALLLTPQPTAVAHIAHLGDSRAYLYRGGTLTPLTRDHTMIEKYLAHGILTPESAKTHPDRHVLTKAVGISATATPDIASHPLQPDDLILLCSDGLTKMLEDQDIALIMKHSGKDPVRAGDTLIEAALARGGLDNVTVVVIAQSQNTHR
ncbi:MAG: protein phosphatase 2C domain-containing protein [Nitrospira sp.]|jgi:serine/threonine protein phosphatase PrpC|nr:protein phosphatase 2C domain-containing protein [Nitrospira sp.]